MEGPQGQYEERDAITNKRLVQETCLKQFWQKTEGIYITSQKDVKKKGR